MESPRITRGNIFSLSGAGLRDLLLEVLNTGKAFRIRVTGNSMWPFVKTHDVITITPVTGKPPRIGEIVAFIHPVCRRLLVHRVVRVSGDGYLLRGDNGQAADGMVPRASILGRVTALHRQGKPVRLGLGIERRLIALLSARGLLGPGVRLLARLAGRKG